MIIKRVRLTKFIFYDIRQTFFLGVTFFTNVIKRILILN